jgi:hypothetical protein
MYILVCVHARQYAHIHMYVYEYVIIYVYIYQVYMCIYYVVCVACLSAAEDTRHTTNNKKI